jgi:hypothetical protein
MKELREQIVLPADVDITESACADCVAKLASEIAPGIERSVGTVHWREGEATGVDWTAEGFVDGALVVVCLRPSSRAVSLLVIPAFASPAGEGSKFTSVLPLGILGASVAVGALRASVWWGLLSFVGAVSAWIGADIVRNEFRNRRAIAAFDGAVWSRRFHDAIANVALRSSK